MNVTLPPGRRTLQPPVRVESGCLEWQGSLDTHGYGHMSIDGRLVTAPRYFYAQAYGPIPEGIQVEHRCRNRACVDPEHLRLATNAENAENQGAVAGTSSRYRGVARVGRYRRVRWAAYVTLNGKQHWLGYHDTEEAAAEAASAFRREHMPFSEMDRGE